MKVQIEVLKDNEVEVEIVLDKVLYQQLLDEAAKRRTTFDNLASKILKEWVNSQ